MIFFNVNGIIWELRFVAPSDPVLINNSGCRTLGCTSILDNTVYISESVRKDKIKNVLTHELAHCVIFSYNIDAYLDVMAKPNHRVDLEELICGIIERHSYEILELATDLLRKV